MKKYKLKYFMVFIILIQVFLLNSCSDKDKQLLDPNFDTEVSFRLTNKSYTVADLVQRSSQVSVDNNSTRQLLKFQTDEIRKDTTLQSFIADVFVAVNQDTTVAFDINDTTNIDMIVQRDSVRVEEADISDGLITYTIDNYSARSGQFKMQIIGCTVNNGGTIDTFTIGGVLPPNGQFQQTKSLSGYKYKLPANQPFASTRPGFWLKGRLTLTGANSSDSVHIKTSVSLIEFSRITGKFKPVPLGTKVQSFPNLLSEKLSDFIKGVYFDSIRVTVKGSTSISGFSIALNKFKVTGVFRDKTKPPIVLHFKNDQGQYEDHINRVFNPSIQTTFIFDKGNTDINDFISSAPDTLLISSDNILNPDYLKGTVRASDSIKISFQAEGWSRWRVNDTKFEDTLFLDISSDIRDKFTRGKNGSIKLELENKIPVGGYVVGYLADSLYRPVLLNGKKLYLTKTVSNDTAFVFNGANVNSNGDVISPHNQTIEKTVTSEELAKLKDVYYAIMEYHISTSNKQIVYLSALDYVSFISSGKLRIELNSGDIKK